MHHSWRRITQQTFHLFIYMHSHTIVIIYVLATNWITHLKQTTCHNIDNCFFTLAHACMHTQTGMIENVQGHAEFAAGYIAAIDNLFKTGLCY